MPFPPVLEELCPATIGEDKIVLSLDAANLNPRAFQSVQVNVDYSACDPDGIVLPLELIIQSPSSANVIRRIIRRGRPPSIVFTPREGGLHGVLLREVAHNRWLGTLRIDVAGDPLNPQIPS